jgi:hypothetical protein
MSTASMMQLNGGLHVGHYKNDEIVRQGGEGCGASTTVRCHASRCHTS